MSVSRIIKNKDRGSATLVTGIISLLFICLCAGFAIDIAKNSYLKSSFTSRAQQSTEVAVQKINPQGSIGENGPQALVSSYTGETGVRDETDVWKTDGCSTREISTWNGDKKAVEMPYIVIRLGAERAVGTQSSVTYVSEGGRPPSIVSGTYDPFAKYTVIAAEVNDSSRNLMLGMFGMSCQDYNAKVSAIAFGSNEDLESGQP
jgi:hypothetical protein